MKMLRQVCFVIKKELFIFVSDYEEYIDEGPLSPFFVG